MPRRAIVVDSSDDASDDGDSSSSQASNDLIDDEAADSDDSRDDASSIEVPLSEQFPQFMKLPIEIRRDIWDLVFPDVASKHHRVLQLATCKRRPDSSHEVATGWAFCEDLATQDQTEQLRQLASIHKETRDIVKKAFPDVITLHPGKAQVHFDSDRDIVVTNVNREVGHHIRDNKMLSEHNHSGRHSAIKHLCFNWKSQFPIESDDLGDFLLVQSVVRDLPNLETVMYAIEAEPGDGLKRSKQWGWVAEEQATEARVNTYQKSFGLGEDLEWAYVWPDFKNHPYFLNQIPGLTDIPIAPEYAELICDKGYRYVPMVIFDYNNLRYLDRLKQRYEERPWSTIDWDQDTSDDDSDNEDDDMDDDINNDYESEGLDDEEIDQWDDHDEDEMIPPPVSPLGGAISVSSDEHVEPPDPLVHSPGPGNFSSPEPDADENRVGPAVHSPEGGNFSSPESETEEDVGLRRPKRRIVSDSDDEDDEPPAKRTKRRTVAESSDEGADQTRQEQQSTSRAAPQLISDDEDEEPRQRPQTGSRGAAQVISDDEQDTSAESSSEEDEDDAPPKKLSLAQRLRAAPTDRPAASDRRDSDDADSFCSYADGEEDEEDEDSEDDDGLVHRMAGDTDDDDGGGESDEGW